VRPGVHGSNDKSSKMDELFYIYLFCYSKDQSCLSNCQGYSFENYLTSSILIWELLDQLYTHLRITWPALYSFESYLTSSILIWELLDQLYTHLRITWPALYSFENYLTIPILIWELLDQLYTHLRITWPALYSFENYLTSSMYIYLVSLLRPKIKFCYWN